MCRKNKESFKEYLFEAQISQNLKNHIRFRSNLCNGLFQKNSVPDKGIPGGFELKKKQKKKREIPGGGRNFDGIPGVEAKNTGKFSVILP